MSGTLWRLLLAGGLSSSLAVIAFAHGEYSWIMDGGYRSPVSKEWCCGPNDCFKIAPEKVHTNAVGYVLDELNETVPYSETLVSQDGRFWRCRRPDGSRRCFFAPPQGS